MCAAVAASVARAGGLRRAAPRAARQSAHRLAAARAGGAGRAGAVPALSARAGPAVGAAAGRLCRHQRALRLDDARQPVAAHAVGRDRVPRRVPGRGAAPARALLARAGDVGLRRPHLAAGHRPASPTCSRRGGGTRVRLFRAARAAQPQLAVRARASGEPARSARATSTTDRSSRLPPVRARMRYDMASVVEGRAERGRSGPQRCAARSACRRASIRARARWPKAGAPPRPATPRCWRARSSFSAASACSTPPNRRCSGAIRWTNSCSTRGRDSASTFPPRSCS